MKHSLWIVAGLFGLMLGCGPKDTTEPTVQTTIKPTPENVTEAPEGFARVQPILTQNCTGCHGEKGKEDFDFRTYASLMKGGEPGAAVVPGKPEESLMVKAVKGQGVRKMPPSGPGLSSDQIATIEAWIQDGAKE